LEDRFTNLLLGDFIYEKIGQIPKRGDSFEYNNLKIRVEEVSNNRVLSAKITAMKPEEEKETKEAKEVKETKETEADAAGPEVKS
jgi:Mg2+/Co2+ transporter CorC